jgi:tRNA threonylcarbamoyladenosine biosynthesis protein TsaE
MGKIVFSGLNNINEAAKQFLEQNKNYKHFAFYGEMGAGKTTFIKELCKHINTVDEVTSPTFSLINEYATTSGKPVYHFDFYRIKNIEDVYDIGYEDYFYSDDYCFVEWPELVEELLPDTMLKVKINILENGLREVLF